MLCSGVRCRFRGDDRRICPRTCLYSCFRLAPGLPYPCCFRPWHGFFLVCELYQACVRRNQYHFRPERGNEQGQHDKAPRPLSAGISDTHSAFHYPSRDTAGWNHYLDAGLYNRNLRTQYFPFYPYDRSPSGFQYLQHYHRLLAVTEAAQ